MARENQVKEGSSSKQKLIAVALVVFVAVIAYQVWGMVKGDSGPSTPIQPAATATVADTTAKPGGANTTNTSTAGAPSSAPGQPSALPSQSSSSLREVNVAMEPRLVDLQKATQQKYLEQVNQLQSLKIQRDIAEMNQAIAAAKLATVTAEKSVSDLLTRPSTQTLLPGVYGSTALAPQGPGIVTTETTSVTLPAQPIAEVPYRVVSVSMELGRWSAVIGFQSKLYNVSIGDVMPVDGSTVVAINKNGITLMKDGKSRKISMTSSV